MTPPIRRSLLLGPALTLLGVLALAAGCGKDDPPEEKEPARTSTPSGRELAGDPTLPEELAPKAEAEPETTEATDAGVDAAPWEGPFFVVTSIAAAVYSEPAFDKKKKVGYARNGGRIPVKAEPVSKKNCSGGWYELVSGGYICGNQGTTDPKHPELKFTIKQPDLDEVLPYKYARNAKNGTPLYKTVPTREQMLEYEPYLDGAKKKKAEKKKAEKKQAENSEEKSEAKASSEKAEPSPDQGETIRTASLTSDGGSALENRIDQALADAGVQLSLDAGAAEQPEKEPEEPWWQREDAKDRLHEVTIEQLHAEADDILAKRMVAGFYIAIDKTFRWNNRTWYKSTKGLVAPQDRFWQTAGSKFQGVELDGEKHKLPVAWVYGGRKTATTYEIDAEKKKITPAGSVKRFEAIQLSGRQTKYAGKLYHETKDGTWIKDHHVRITSPNPPPKDLRPGERWIDVNLSEQTLVAFDGARPVYATLISTGKESRKKEKDHRTPTGQWRIREKHVTTTMDGDGTAAGDLPYSIEDVPYVMYFHRSYAVHGAFWHRNFGIQMSHGCINLAPLDAKHLFFFADPPLPEGWHGAWSNDDTPGSLVVVHE